LQISIGKACNPPCFSHLTKGRQFQLAKYSHNWTPTLHQCATQDNSIDWCCFTCGAWLVRRYWPRLSLSKWPTSNSTITSQIPFPWPPH
jgi:hypothetical protein